jgi:hypothetical protein
METPMAAPKGATLNSTVRDIGVEPHCGEGVKIELISWSGNEGARVKKVTIYMQPNCLEGAGYVADNS